MGRVFVNALNAKAAGGRSILLNYLASLHKGEYRHEYRVVVPDPADFEIPENEHIQILATPPGLSRTALFPVVNALVLPRMAHAHACDVIFNLSDVPMPTAIPQVMLFDWPYAVYPESGVWGRMDRRSRWTRFVKLWFFERYLRYVDVVLAQTNVAKERLARIYGVEDVVVIPNSVSVIGRRPSTNRDFMLGPGLNLLCLTHYYPHKNLEVLLPLADLIRRRDEGIRIVTTIAAEQHPAAAAFLDEVERRDLKGVIRNVGPVPMEDVPALYEQSDGLLLPTLLESFSGTYIEAMYFERSIYTSDLDFARDVCRDAAYYFDPSDPYEILERILESRRDRPGREAKLRTGREIANETKTWSEIAEAIEFEIDRVIEDSRCAEAGNRQRRAVRGISG